MNTVGKWLYLIGLLVAGVLGVVAVATKGSFSADWLTVIMVLVGVLAAVLYFDTTDLVGAGVRFLVLGVVYQALGVIPGVGSYLTGFFGGVLAFLGPVLLTALVMYFVKKYFFAKK